jgi:hypothetical protein
MPPHTSTCSLYEPDGSLLAAGTIEPRASTPAGEAW